MPEIRELNDAMEGFSMERKGKEQAVLIRSWEKGDDRAVWNALRDGHLSNINSVFFVLLHKPPTQGLVVLCPAVTFALGCSWLALFFSCVFGFALVYFLALFGVLGYIYGDMKDAEDIERHYFSKPDSHFWVAVCDGEIAGCVAVYDCTASHSDSAKSAPDGPHRHSLKKISNNLTEKTAELKRMSVRNKFRRRGIANGLLKELEAFCVKHDYKSIYLTTTEAQNHAISLYSRYGFSLVGFETYKGLLGLITVNIHAFAKKLM